MAEDVAGNGVNMSEFFTSLTKTDVETILSTIAMASNGKDCIRFCEVGTFGGATARGIKHWCDQHGVKLEYHAVDDSSHPGFEGNNRAGAPFDGAIFHDGKSWEVAHRVPFDCDVILIDGDHSFNGVILDTMWYSERVKLNGYLMYHDCSPSVQYTFREQYGPDIPRFRNCVNDALILIRWPFKGWQLIVDRYDGDADFGGMRVYQRYE